MSQQTTNSGRLRVLQLGKFYPPQRGGMESHIKTLCDRLRPEVDLDVLVSGVEGRTVQEVCDGVPVTRIGRLAQVNSTSVNPALVAAIRRSDADVIHLHWPNPMAALAYRMSGHPGKLVVTYHSDVVKQRFLRHVFGPVLHTVLMRAKAIVVSSSQYLESSPVLRRYREKCHVIPFGIADENFALPMEDAAGAAESVYAARAQYGEQIVLSVGRLVDYKGFDTLIRAMVEAPGRLLIVGDGPCKDDLVALVRSLELGDRVAFLGDISDERLRILYHAAVVFVLASANRREAFGIVQVEAMAAGKPVINTDVDSGVGSVSLHRVTGLTVPHSDAGALAAAIRTLLDDAKLRAVLGQAARRRAETMFRVARMSAATMRVYHSALLQQTVVSEARVPFHCEREAAVQCS